MNNRIYKKNLMRKHVATSVAQNHPNRFEINVLPRYYRTNHGYKQTWIKALDPIKSYYDAKARAESFIKQFRLYYKISKKFYHLVQYAKPKNFRLYSLLITASSRNYHYSTVYVVQTKSTKIFGIVKFVPKHITRLIDNSEVRAVDHLHNVVRSLRANVINKMYGVKLLQSHPAISSDKHLHVHGLLLTINRFSKNHQYHFIHYLSHRINHYITKHVGYSINDAPNLHLLEPLHDHSNTNNLDKMSDVDFQDLGNTSAYDSKSDGVAPLTNNSMDYFSNDVDQVSGIVNSLHHEHHHYSYVYPLIPAIKRTLSKLEPVFIHTSIYSALQIFQSFAKHLRITNKATTLKQFQNELKKASFKNKYDQSMAQLVINGIINKYGNRSYDQQSDLEKALLTALEIIKFDPSLNHVTNYRGYFLNLLLHYCFAPTIALISLKAGNCKAKAKTFADISDSTKKKKHRIPAFSAVMVLLSLVPSISTLGSTKPVKIFVLNYILILFNSS